MIYKEIKGHIAFVTHGKYAGKCGFIIAAYNIGDNDRNYTHCLLCLMKKKGKKFKYRELQTYIPSNIFKFNVIIRYFNINHLNLTTKKVPTVFTTWKNLRTIKKKNEKKKFEKTLKRLLIFNFKNIKLDSLILLIKK